MSSTVQNQHTLASSASLTGTSLHTGENVTLTLHPAEPGTGFKFRRRDLPDEPTISASIENVRMVERATTLGEGNIKVQTVEHVIAALSGMGVDNAIIEMDANEPPIGDGSALAFLQLIQKAGIVEQQKPRPFFEVREPIHVETKEGSILTLVPYDGFKISCTQVGPQGRFTQYYSTEITPKTFETELASARTFVFYEDIKPLMDKGLIKGGSLENAVVVQGDAVHSKEPLRFPDEFVRHKILDIVGDIALFGRRIKGHVIAVKPGHGPNAELTRALAKEHSRVLAMIPPQQILPKGEAVIDIKQIMTILPHRYPFLMVDRIVGFEGEHKCVGVKSVTINEPYFQGHFPGHPIMPGVLQVEAMAQVSSVLMLRQPENLGKIGYFMSADGVKFRKPVLPGDTLFIHVELTRSRKSLGKSKCYCTTNNEVVSEAELMFAIVDR